MIFKQLTIHNIASIADAHIDFINSDLATSSIFLISGETGAGKSTILDAICLALYAQTPRMSAANREELAPKIEGKNIYYANDNAQLLRRGTGEGWVKLLFEGNDGMDYEAVWSVQRDHKKAAKKLQKPKRSLRSVSDDSFNETHKKEIEDKIAELTALDYDQFCRTVMLAQGEFTKFLKSNKGEKSSILEKLTGTGIYTLLGKKIADRYISIKKDFDSINLIISQISLLSDEEKRLMEEKQLKTTSLISEKKKELAGIDAGIIWKKETESIRKSITETDVRINSLETIKSSESFKNDCLTVSDYRTTVTPRLWLSEIEKVKSKENTHKALQSQLIINIGKEKIGIKNLEKEIEETDKLIVGKHKEINSCDIRNVNKSLSQLNERKNLLKEILFNYNSLRDKEKSLEEVKKEIENNLQFKLRYERELKELQHEKGKSDFRLQTVTASYESVINSTSKAAVSLRAMLKEGEMCPVCGQKVTTVLDSGFFAEIVGPLKEEKKKAEKSANEIEGKIIAANKILENSTERESVLNERLSQLEITKSEISQTLKDLLDKSQEIVLTDHIIDDLNDATARLNADIEKKEKIQELYLRLNGELNQLTEKLNSRKAKLDTKKVDLEKANKAFSAWETTMKEYRLRREELRADVDDFLNLHPEITEERIKSLSALSDSFINTLEIKIKETEDSLKREKGAIELLKSNLKSKLDSEPEVCNEASIESLSEIKDKLENAIGELHQEDGKIAEQLKMDRINRELHAENLKKAKAIEVEMDKWEILYRYLGDRDGSKFRSIAQSYILSSLLENANVYMNAFSNRYTLTCNPGSLSILVRDALRPSEPQPASILSGGESFMASLSLALALANLKDGGVGIDILFIDEGFGTLSVEYLEKVMDTLEKLHQIGGRKVGLISHVAEMKERIPVQIQVVRESPTLSKIKIVS